MNRNQFIKTLALGAGVLTTGISVAKSTEVKTYEIPVYEITGIKMTLSELLENDKYLTQVYVMESRASDACHLSVMFWGVPPEDRIIITDHPLHWDTFGTMQPFEHLRWVTLEFENHQALYDGVAKLLKPAGHGTVSYQVQADVRGYMRTPRFKNGIRTYRVLKFEVVNGRVVTYVKIDGKDYRHDGTSGVLNKYQSSLAKQITQPFKESW